MCRFTRRDHKCSVVRHPQSSIQALFCHKNKCRTNIARRQAFSLSPKRLNPIAKLQAKGYNTNALIWVPLTCR
jgi:hypothetical protein